MRLGEVCELSKGRTPREEWYSASGVWLVRFRDVTSSGVNWIAGFRTFVDETYSRELKELKPGTVLVTADAHDPKSIGKKICLISSVPPHASPAYYSGELLGITPKSGSELIPELVLYWFQSEDGYREIQEYVDGVHLNVGHAKDMKIPLPPTLAEQERIARIVNEQMTAVEKAHAAAEARLEAAKALPAAYLRAVFESQEAHRWRREPLGDQVTKVGSGLTPLGGQSTYQKSGTPLIRSQNVHMNHFVLEGLAYISREIDEEMAGSRVYPGDVLLNITGASIGRVCIVPSELCPANVNQHVSIIRCKDSLNPDFLSFYLSTPEFQQFIMNTQAGATRQALTKTIIEQFEIPVPSLEEQSRLVATLRNEIGAAGKVMQVLQEELGTIDALPAALLRRAFTGGL